MQPSPIDAQWRELIDHLSDGSPGLADIQLEADGHFQRLDTDCRSLATAVVGHLKRSFAHIRRCDLPQLYYACGSARVGSTALANVMGIAGIPAYYQPVKSILRSVLQDSEPTEWTLPDGATHVFAKETFGPYSLAECIFMPVSLLLDAGFPPDRLHIIVLDREPAAVLSSWILRWSHRVPERTLLRHYVLAALNAERVAQHAKRCGLRTTTYVYELSKSAPLFIPKLFNRLGLDDRYQPSSIAGWGLRGDFGSGRSAVVFPDEPLVFNVPGLHGADLAYRYHAQARPLASQYSDALIESGVQQKYLRSVRACIADFSMDCNTATDIFGDAALFA